MAKLFNYLRYENFLETYLNKSILEYTIENEFKFVDAKVKSRALNSSVNKNYRICKINYDLGILKEDFESKILEKFEEICGKLQIQPFEITSVETQIAAHGDGAFFTQHIDTHTHIENNSKGRVISAVYYFFNEPKQFEGGELILHPFPFMDGDDTSVSLAPLNNSLVIFPSFGMHEVLPVKCPNVQFKDWRFAINCWINKA